MKFIGFGERAVGCQCLAVLYLLFKAEDLDAAVDLASMIPAASQGGAIEVRPIVEW